MRQEGSCGPDSKAEANGGYEVVRIEKTKNICRLCEDPRLTGCMKPDI